MNVFDVLREKFETKKENCIHNQKKFENQHINSTALICEAMSKAFESTIEIVNQVEQEYNKKSEPMNDLIEYGVDGYNHHLKEKYRKGYEDGLNADKWIPCSERLPNKEEFLKDDGRFIVTDGNRKYESIYDIYCRCFKTLKLFDFNLNGRDARFEVDKCVIAWQPLPPKYEPKGE